MLASFAVLLLAPEGNGQMFLFYSMRESMLYAMLVYLAARYIGTRDDVLRLRMRRHRALYGALWALVTCVLLENVVFLLVIDPHAIAGQRLPFFPERNFAENALMLCCAFFACRDAFRVLSLRFERPPMHEGGRQEELIDDNLLLYGKRYRLSERECEVLRYVLVGKDNQNIASAMHLALSTVKVHVHNILQKTGQPNRQALVQDFWKTS